MIFSHGHDDSIDAVCIITPGRFVTGSQDGSIALWSTAKKHPLQKEKDVHVSRDPMDVRHQKKTLRHWIVSLSAKHNADVFASGSSDGVVKLWSVRNNSFYHLRSIRIPKGAFVNCMQWADSGKMIICGLGDEHRLGRWEHVNGARNGIAIIRLPVGWQDVPPGMAGKESEESIEFESAEEWDKWDPREKGDAVKEDTQQNGHSKKAKGDGGDKEEEEWKSFFGNVFT